MSNGWISMPLSALTFALQLASTDTRPCDVEMTLEMPAGLHTPAAYPTPEVGVRPVTYRMAEVLDLQGLTDEVSRQIRVVDDALWAA